MSEVSIVSFVPFVTPSLMQGELKQNQWKDSGKVEIHTEILNLNCRINFANLEHCLDILSR